MKKIICVLMALLLFATVFACSPAAAPAAPSADTAATTAPAAEAAAPEAASTEPIKIGLVSMITGGNPLSGERMNQAVQLAVDEVNQAGGIMDRQVELLIEDDQTTADMAVTCVNKLISDGVCAIIGPHRSTNALAVADVIKDAGVPLFTGGTTPAIAELGNPFLFRVRASDSIVAAAAVQFATQEQGSKKVGVFYNSDDYGTGAMKVITAYCDSNGIEYVAEGHNTDDTDFTAQLVKMKEAGIDSVIIWTHQAEAAIAVRQVYELGLNVPVITGPAGAESQFMDLVEKEYVEGMYAVTDFVVTNTDPVTVEFAKKFKDTYGVDPDNYAAFYYGAAVCLLDAIKRAESTDCNAIRDAIAQTSGLAVPVGEMNCDSVNDLVHETLLARIADKVPQYIKTIKVA